MPRGRGRGKVSLGDVTLRFMQAPFLHWPDSLFTFAEEEGILFSGDVFSFHMAGEDLFDDEIAWTGEMEAAQRYYFDTLLAPFRSYVLDALEKIRGLSIRMIAPAHGPLRRAESAGAFGSIPGICVGRPGIRHPKGVCRLCLLLWLYPGAGGGDIPGGHPERDGDGDGRYCRSGAGTGCGKIRRMDAVALGSPTVNQDALKPVWKYWPLFRPTMPGENGPWPSAPLPGAAKPSAIWRSGWAGWVSGWWIRWPSSCGRTRRNGNRHMPWENGWRKASGIRNTPAEGV